MDTKILVDKNIKDGKKLLKDLDDHRYPVNAALWFFDQNSATWKYIISTPKVDKEGTLKVYKEIQNLLQESKQDIALKDISVVSPTDDLVRTLQLAITTEPKDISGIRFSRNIINNFFVEDSYIYRLAK